MLVCRVSNIMDFSDTSESFGTMCLHDSNIRSTDENCMADCNDINLTSNQKCIAKCMWTKLPFLIVITIDEQKLFTSLCTSLNMNIPTISNTMNIHVNGKNIYPKLEVHLRTHLVTWKKNKHIEAFLSSAKVDIDHLKTISIHRSFDDSRRWSTQSN